MARSTSTEGYAINGFPVSWKRFVDAVSFGGVGLQARCGCQWTPPPDGEWPKPHPLQPVDIIARDNQRIAECSKCGGHIVTLQLEAE